MKTLVHTVDVKITENNIDVKRFLINFVELILEGFLNAHDLFSIIVCLICFS